MIVLLHVPPSDLDCLVASTAFLPTACAKQNHKCLYLISMHEKSFLKTIKQKHLLCFFFMIL